MAATSICDSNYNYESYITWNLTLKYAIHSSIYPDVQNYAVSNTVLCLLKFLDISLDGSMWTMVPTVSTAHSHKLEIIICNTYSKPQCICVVTIDPKI